MQDKSASNFIILKAVKLPRPVCLCQNAACPQGLAALVGMEQGTGEYSPNQFPGTTGAPAGIYRQAAVHDVNMKTARLDELGAVNTCGCSVGRDERTASGLHDQGVGS